MDRQIYWIADVHPHYKTKNVKLLMLVFLNLQYCGYLW